MTEPLPPELDALFAAEKAAPAASQAARAALRARIAKSVAHLPLGAAASLGVGKMLAILAVVVGVGAGTFALTRGRGEPASIASVAPTITPPSRIVQPVVAAPASPPVPVVPSPVVAPPPVKLVPVGPTPAPTDSRPTTDITAAGSLPSQATLLAQAWAALGSGAADRALGISFRDEQLHPDGALREEREALEIVALAKLQRGSEAHTAASKFFERYPNSVHRALVARSLEPR